MASLNISISAEPIFHLGNFAFTNSMFVSLLTTVFLSLVAIRFYRFHKSKKPSKLNLFIQVIIESFYEFVQTITPHKASQFFPLIASIFLFVMFASWAGLLPGVETIGFRNSHGFIPLFRGGTADINITMGTAIAAVFMVQVFGYKSLGIKYFKKFFDFSNPIKLFVGFLELVSEFARIVSFSFRLFGNIFAGEVLLMVIAFLLPLFGPLPFIGLELFIGFIQALVFSTLTLVFISIAVSHH